MSSINTKYKQIVDALYANTKSKSVLWKLTDRGNPYTQFGNYSVLLENKEDADGAPYILVTITDILGKFIDNFSDNTLSEDSPSDSDLESYWKVMDTLIETARRQARGADSALDEILNQLNKSGR
jgi:hypothetical protein